MVYHLNPTEYGIVIVVTFPIILASVLYIYLHQQCTAVISLPWVGRKQGWLSMIRANLRECYWPGSNTIAEGYAKVHIIFPFTLFLVSVGRYLWSTNFRFKL